MLDNITSISPAVQDSLSLACRAPFFEGMPNLVTGRVEIEEAMREFIELREEEASSVAEE